MKKLLLIAGLFWSAVASAQFVPGQVLTAAELNSQFALYAPLTGATFTGSIAGTSAAFSGLVSVPSLTATGTISLPTASLPLPYLAAQAANSIVANSLGATASPTAVAIPSCSTSSSALQWSSGFGFLCNTAINSSTLGGTAAASYALLASPTFTGVPAAPTPSSTTNSTQIATTAFVQSNFAAPQIPYGSGTPNSVAATTISATALISPSSTVGIKGTTTNDNAQAGSIGEYQVNSTTGTSLTSDITANATSIVNLSAGDWEVWGEAQFNPAAGTVISILQVGVSATSATLGGLGTKTLIQTTFTTAAAQTMASPRVRISIAAPTTIYLAVDAHFSVSTCTVDGFIRARRIR